MAGKIEQLTPFDHSLGFFSGEAGSCSDGTELWCQINPTYTTLDINPGHSETINCTLPSTPGAWSTINFVNQLGRRVTDLPNVDLYRIDSSSSGAEKTFHVNISWTLDKDIREQLKVIQCKANFQCRSRPYNSSVVSINFVDIEQGMLYALRIQFLMASAFTKIYYIM